MRPIILLFLLLLVGTKSNCQIKSSSLELLGGARLLRGSNPQNGLLIGLGKDYKVVMGHIMPNVRFSIVNEKSWALLFGFDYTYTKKFVVNSPYFYGNLSFVLQSDWQKTQTDYGFFTGQLGLGYPITNANKIEAGMGLTISDTFYWEFRLRNTIKYKYKKAIRALRCPPLH